MPWAIRYEEMTTASELFVGKLRGTLNLGK
jgi:hypothetical protein